MRRVLTGRKMKLVVAIFCAVALAAGAFVWGMGSSPGSGQIIATVDGTTITRSELQANVDQMKMMYQMQGQEVTPELENQLRQTVLNELISEVLIYHEAEARGVTVPQEDIEEQYEMILAQFDDEEAFEDALRQADMTRDELREDIARHLTVEMFLESHAEEVLEAEGIDVSEEDLRAMYDHLEEQGQADGTFEEMRPALRQSLLQQERQQIVARLSQELREDANIEIHQ